MWRFELIETKDSIHTIFAQGVEFTDGSYILRRINTKHPSTEMYASLIDFTMRCLLPGIRLVWYPLDETDREGFRHGELNCKQNYLSNAPFASVGGLESRPKLQAPRWATEKGDDYANAYIRGYIYAAVKLYGGDWATCSFGWTPAPKIGG